jgi:enoyl-CoA hydratase/carnithine racemase
MFAVVEAHVPAQALHDSCLSGQRYSGPEALAAGIVDEVAAEDDVLDRAVALAAELAGKNREVIREHKRLLYGDAIATCGACPRLHRTNHPNR